MKPLFWTLPKNACCRDEATLQFLHEVSKNIEMLKAIDFPTSQLPMLLLLSFFVTDLTNIAFCN